MRIKASDARELSDKKGKADELDIVCSKILTNAIEGRSQVYFYPAVKEETKQWLELNGYEVESKEHFTTVRWNKASL